MTQNDVRPRPIPEEECREFLREEIEKLRQFAESIDDPELNRQLARDDEELIDEAILEHRALRTESDREIPCLNHDGKEEALKVAMAYRDKIEVEMSDPASPVKASKMARSKTGVPGLSITERDRGGGTKAYVQLSWLDSQGERHAKAYSIEKWGLRRALWNACAKLAMQTQQDANKLYATAFKHLKQYE